MYLKNRLNTEIKCRDEGALNQCKQTKSLLYVYKNNILKVRQNRYIHHVHILHCLKQLQTKAKTFKFRSLEMLI